MKIDEEALYKMALTLVPGVGGTNARKLLAYAGSERSLFENIRDLESIAGFPKRITEGFKSPEVMNLAKYQLDYAVKNDIALHYFTDEDFPKKLSACNDAPALFFSRGAADVDIRKTIGIVGTRSTDAEGRDNIFKLVEDLSQSGYKPIIISGLAAGADTFAHKAALKFNLATVAVSGTGFDTVYPAENRPLFNDIINNNGMTITEFYYRHPISPSNFVRRNRIVAGLCDAIVVAQSKINGGALITASIAQSYQRGVFAFPGKAGDKLYQGCNELIKKRTAELITSSKDLEIFLGWQSKKSQQPVQKSLFPDFSPQEKAIVDILAKEGKLSCDMISKLTGLPGSIVCSTATALEIYGAIIVLPGKLYKLV